MRLVRLFVDDRNAAEDLVQEGFIRLARNAGRIKDEAKAAAYLRSIVLNLARDHNRRGLVSLRHHLPFDQARASTEDEIVLRDDQQEVIDALRELPAPPTHLPRAPLLRGAGHRRHRRDARHLPELGEDPPAPGHGGAGSAARVMSVIEERLRDALGGGAAALDESDDLFARVRLSIEDDAARRRQARRRLGTVACLAGAVAAVVLATVDHRQGELIMDWWILELLWFALMVGLALWLGPFIRRFGKSYAADVFRANPRTGKSFIVLMDVAYYLIFVAFILFTVHFEPDRGWADTVERAPAAGQRRPGRGHPPHRRASCTASTC